MIELLIVLVVIVTILGWIHRQHREEREPKISLLVPFKPSDPQRVRVWEWLEDYWLTHLPEAEIVIGIDLGLPFSKTCAVNDAASRASGDVFVILDADAFLDAEVIRHCAREIRKGLRQNRHVWYVPYRRLFRLTPEATDILLESSPENPVLISDPPPPWAVESTLGSGHGHWFGAMCQIMPRDAFEDVGGMDPRFRGWGGEDISFMHAVDTLWGKHRTVDNQLLHLWHYRIQVGDDWLIRQWRGQDRNNPNGNLAQRYHMAMADVERMRLLTREYSAEGDQP